MPVGVPTIAGATEYLVMDLDALATALFKPLAKALEELGSDEVVSIIADLSVPVDYSTFPPNRSEPGEPPRLDSGDLAATVDHAVTAGDVGDRFPTLEVSAGGPGAPYGAGLDQGTEVNTFTNEFIESRPFMSEFALPRLAARAAEVVGKHLAEGLGH